MLDGIQVGTQGGTGHRRDVALLHIGLGDPVCVVGRCPIGRWRERAAGSRGGREGSAPGSRSAGL